jgi:hypothetical protein
MLMMSCIRKRYGLLLGALVLAGCTGVPLRVPGNGMAAGEESLGQVTGKATGIMLFNCIPIGQNGRFQEAYKRALASAPGATRIVDVTIQERWFWAWVLNGYKFELTGTAVRPKP